VIGNWLIKYPLAARVKPNFKILFVAQACVNPIRNRKEKKNSHGMLQKVSNGVNGVRSYLNGKSFNRRPETAPDNLLFFRGL